MLPSLKLVVLLLVAAERRITADTVDAVREATFANRLNGNSDINKAAQQTADQLAPGQGELSRSHEAAFAQGVRDTVGGAAQGGGAQHTPPALPPMPVVHRTTWDEAAPSPGVVQPSAEGQSAEERPAASAADGLANDLRDLQNVADKLGDGKVDAELQRVEEDLSTKRNQPPVAGGGSSRWVKSWHVLSPSTSVTARTAPEGSVLKPAAPSRLKQYVARTTSGSGPEGAEATGLQSKTDWDHLRNQFRKVPGHALPVTNNAPPPTPPPPPAVGDPAAIALCQASCWGKRGKKGIKAAVCTDKRRYVVGERVVVCMRGLPGLQGDGAGIYLNGKLYSEKSSTVDANNHVVSKGGSYSHAADLSFFDTLDKNVHHKPSAASMNDAVYWVNSDGSRGQGAFLTTKKAISKSAVLFRPVSLPVGVYSMRLFFGNDPHKPKAAYMFTVVDGAESFQPAQGNVTIMSMNMMVAARGHVQQVADAVFMSGADFVGLQECDIPSLSEIKEMLRAKDHAKYRNAEVVHYFLPHGLGTQYICIVSVHPILEHYTMHGLWAHGIKSRLPDGTVVRVFNAHLEAFPYGPYMVRDGKSALEAHSATLRQTADVTHALSEIVEAEDNLPDLTTFFVGDFNCPSPLDWSDDNILQNGAVVPWGPSTAMLNHDFTDSFRLAHPDVLNHRGFSWTAGLDANPKNMPINEVHDRIDFTFHRAADDEEITVSQSYVTKDIDPWPSDHRAVVTSYLLIHNGPTARAPSARAP